MILNVIYFLCQNLHSSKYNFIYRYKFTLYYMHAQVELVLYLQRMRFELLAAGSVGLSLLVLTTPLRHSFNSSLN